MQPVSFTGLKIKDQKTKDAIADFARAHRMSQVQMKSAFDYLDYESKSQDVFLKLNNEKTTYYENGRVDTLSIISCDDGENELGQLCLLSNANSFRIKLNNFVETTLKELKRPPHHDEIDEYLDKFSFFQKSKS